MTDVKSVVISCTLLRWIGLSMDMSNTETLTVTKRGSKEQQQIPVVTVSLDGTRYLVSTRGE